MPRTPGFKSKIQNLKSKIGRSPVFKGAGACLVTIHGRAGCGIAQICARTKKRGDSRNSHRRAIYQPALYECSKQLSPVARILAEVFKYLNEGKVREIEAATPADEGTPVGALIEVFHLERFVSKIGVSLPQMN